MGTQSTWGVHRTTMVKSVKKPAKAEFPLNLVAKKPRTFSIGGDILPKQDLTRFVKWPKYIRIQRSRRVLYQRIKIPPAINQFKNTFDKRAASQLFPLPCPWHPLLCRQVQGPPRCPRWQEDRHMPCRHRCQARAQGCPRGTQAAVRHPLQLCVRADHEALG